jgi:GNAT superfamily N-acetyltransferase
MPRQAATMTTDDSVSTLSQAIDAERFRLRDGRWVLVRRVSKDDAPRLSALCERVSEESSRLRFFRAGRRLTAREALSLADVDRERNEAFVALDADRVVALGSLNQLGKDPAAELTLLVDDAYHGGGLGRHLLGRLIDAARTRQYRMLLAEMLPDNGRMLALLESCGLPSIADEYFGVLRVHLFLDSGSPGGD